MPIAISTPSWEKLIDPLNTSARNPNRGCERPEENRASKFCDRRGNGLLMRLSIGARLMVPHHGENREINTQPDENGAKCHADHAEAAEKELPERKRYQAREQKANCHAQ